jgi:hypothetical protein
VGVGGQFYILEATDSKVEGDEDPVGDAFPCACLLE